MKFRLMAAGAVATLALLASVAPTLAQYYPYPPVRPYYDEPRYGGPRYGGPGYYSPYQRPVVVGNICDTSRGACRIRPAPEGSSCRCNIPGFGPKRGAVVVD